MARQWASLGVTRAPWSVTAWASTWPPASRGCLLEDALRLIAVRAKRVNELPQAVMLAVMLPEEELLGQLPADLSVSLINGPSHCVIAGAPEAVAAFERKLTEQGVIARRGRTGMPFTPGSWSRWCGPSRKKSGK